MRTGSDWVRAAFERMIDEQEAEQCKHRA